MRMTSWRMRTVRASLLLYWLTMPAPGIGAEQKRPETAPPASPPQGQAATERAPAPASTFTPSEKIKADSSVAFPVDI